MKVQRPQRRIGWITGVVLVLAASVASRRTTTQEGGIPLIDCPGDSETVIRVPLAGPIGNIPEFHDCQRFPDSHGSVYTSRYAIFAAFRLDSLLPDLRNNTNMDSVAGPGGKSLATVPVATIYTSNGTYPRLGVRPGFNCLFLYAHPFPPGTQPTQWGAKMVSIGANSNCLDHQLNPYPPAVGKVLQVKPSRPDPRFKDADYPAVARWDWDPKRKEQYIGIKCGAAWCEVGDSGFTPSRAYPGPRPRFAPVPGVKITPAMKARVTAIKGWYDAQMLARVVPGQDVRPGPAHGFVIPNPALDVLSSLPSSDGLKFYTDQWVNVGSAMLSRDYGKWSFTRGENRIWFCSGTARSCGVPLEQPPVSPSTMSLASCEPDVIGNQWWAKIVSHAGTKYVCVVRTDHSKQLQAWMKANPGYSVKLPGAARWQWLYNDEGNWLSCPGGCCKYQ
jgi:hypothetical protein